MNELEKRKVVETYFHNGQSASQIWKLVKDLGISRATVYSLVKKFQNDGSSDRKLGFGGELLNKNRSAKRKIADRLRRNPAQSVRKIGIPKSTAQDIVRRDLKLRAKKKEKKQALTSPQKAKRETQNSSSIVGQRLAQTSPFWTPPLATGHQSRRFLRTENIDFCTKEDWPPNSPDINPFDYAIWGVLEQEVYRKPPKNLQDLESKFYELERNWICPR